jgi:hypothetical protein
VTTLCAESQNFGSRLFNGVSYSQPLICRIDFRSAHPHPEIISLALFAGYRYAQAMKNFDYSAPAELFSARGRSGLKYQRFAKAAEAIRFAVEKLPGRVQHFASMEVEDERYDAKQIRKLYQSDKYPLARK